MLKKIVEDFMAAIDILSLVASMLVGWVVGDILSGMTVGNPCASVLGGIIGAFFALKIANTKKDVCILYVVMPMYIVSTLTVFKLASSWKIAAKTLFPYTVSIISGMTIMAMVIIYMTNPKKTKEKDSGYGGPPF